MSKQSPLQRKSWTWWGDVVGGRQTPQNQQCHDSSSLYLTYEPKIMCIN